MWEQHILTVSIRYDPDKIFGSVLSVYIDLGDFFQRCTSHFPSFIATVVELRCVTRSA